MKQSVKVKVTNVRRQRISMADVTLRALCNDCGREVETLTPVQAAEVLEVEVQMLNAMISLGRVHAFETVSGSVRICKDSLFDG